MGYRNKLLRENMVELGKWLFEIGPMWAWPMSKLNQKINSITGAEAIHECLKQGQGVLIATPHLGNWELAGLACSEAFPMTILYKPPNIPGLEDKVRQARGKAGANVVSTGRQGLKQMMEALKAGQAVGMLPDQEPAESTSGVFAPFFGQPAFTMTFFQKLVRKTGAAVFFTVMKRLPKGQGYEYEMWQVTDDIANEDEVVAATVLNQQVERCILACPEQYLWAYKRFKQQPEGHPPVYDV